MTSARCPICDDIISLGVSLKLYQAIICPTCLGSLRVVSLNPLELELPDRPTGAVSRPVSRSGGKKSSRDNKKKSSSRRFGEFDDVEDDYDDLDDYILERRLRHKPERDKYPKTTDRS